MDSPNDSSSRLAQALAGADAPLRRQLARVGTPGGWAPPRPGGRTWSAWVAIEAPVPKGNGREIHYPFRKGGVRKCYGCGRPMGRPIVRETVRVKKAERLAIGVASCCAPPEPLTGALRLDVVTVLPIRPSWPKWKKQAARAGLWWPTSANDGDRGNHLKMVEDVLEAARFYPNDAQVCAGAVGKTYGDRAGYLVALTELAQVTSLAEWKEALCAAT